MKTEAQDNLLQPLLAVDDWQRVAIATLNTEMILPLVRVLANKTVVAGFVRGLFLTYEYLERSKRNKHRLRQVLCILEQELCSLETGEKTRRELPIYDISGCAWVLFNMIDLIRFPMLPDMSFESCDHMFNLLSNCAMVARSGKLDRETLLDGAFTPPLSPLEAHQLARIEYLLALFHHTPRPDIAYLRALARQAADEFAPYAARYARLMWDLPPHSN